MTSSTLASRYVPVKDILDFQDEAAFWADTGVTFHRPTCRYAVLENSGPFRDAVLDFLSPCQLCWRPISPARLHRLTNALLYLEREGVSVDELT